MSFIQDAEQRLNAQNRQIPAFIRQRELMTLLPFSPATLWRKVQNGSFPKSVKLSERITAWDRNQVIAWLESKGGAL